MIDSWVVAYAIDSAQSSVAVDDRLLSLWELLDEAARFGAVYGAVATAIHAADIPDVHGHEAALSLCEDLHVQVELCSIE